MAESPRISKGIYCHYKNGKSYEVLGVALQTEMNESLVIYRPLYDTGHEFFARPYSTFTEVLEVNGVLTPRFKKDDE